MGHGHPFTLDRSGVVKIHPKLTVLLLALRFFNTQLGEKSKALECLEKASEQTLAGDDRDCDRTGL